MSPAPDPIPPPATPARDGRPAGWFKRWLDSLERMSATRTNNRVSMVLDVVTPVVLLSAVAWLGPVRLWPAVGVVLAGLLVFTFVEYVFHRWIFHGDVTLEAFRKGHANHHVDPLVDAALPFFLPPAIVLLMVGVFALAMPVGYATLLAGTIALGYACYDWSHYIIHVRRFRHPWLRRWAGAHHVHHFHPDYNFGVTTLLWDYVLGTHYVSKSRKPRRA
ncbi:MAG: sterol desaturase family protein [Proteobacteria bacterium]|nr:sterol desaturase family protein [Pseudomonadota bacterium]